MGTPSLPGKPGSVVYALIVILVHKYITPGDNMFAFWFVITR